MTLINAVSEIESCKFKIAGNGPLLEELTAYVRSTGREEKIEFRGHQNRSELIKLYKKCKFVVIPSKWYEPSGLIIFEAFACGKPVVGSRIGGIPEFVRDTERGFIFGPGDKEDLFAVIRYLLNNRHLAAEMGRNSREFITSEMGPDRHYGVLMKIYSDVLSHQKSV